MEKEDHTGQSLLPMSKREKKQKAIELHKRGFSFKEIAVQLSIGKTTAHTWVNDYLYNSVSVPARSINASCSGNIKENRSMPFHTVPNLGNNSFDSVQPSDDFYRHGRTAYGI